jgi:hypothetical protein
MPATVPTLTDVVPGAAGVNEPAAEPSVSTPPLPRAAHVPAQRAARTPPAALPRAVSRNAALPHWALGALALGALAVGALAIGRLAIHWLAVRRAHIGHLRIDDLDIGRVHLDGADAPWRA